MHRFCVLAVVVVTAAGCGAATNRAGSAAADASSSGSDTQHGPVGHATQLDIVAGNHAIVVRWQLEGGAAPDLWRIEWHAQGPLADALEGRMASGTLAMPRTARAATVTGLANHVEYRVRVSAVDDGKPQEQTTAEAPVTPGVEPSSLVFVPAGVFTMGEDERVHYPSAEPAHPVYLDAFWIDRLPATNADYRACVDAGACDPPVLVAGFVPPSLERVDDYFGDPTWDDYPVVNLDWAQAKAYCEWRGMRLPTEAEWEKAARGDDPVPQVYPWGDDPPDCNRANYNDEGLFCWSGPVPVGFFGEVNTSPWGVVEMAGNAWEWTADWYDPNYYAHSPCYNPKGPDSGTERVLRGGSWYYGPDALMAHYRNHSSPVFDPSGSEFGDYRGFGVRCVQPAPEAPCDPATARCEIPEGWSCPDGSTGGPDAGTQGSDADATPGGDAADAGAEPTDALDAGSAPDSADAGSLPDTGPPADALDAGADTSPDAGPDASDTQAPPPDAPSQPDTNGPCVTPQEASKPDPTACFNVTPPACPSGWPKGCDFKVCSCALGLTTDPGDCGEQTLTLTVGWLDLQKKLHAFTPGQDYEICEGFQGGVHFGMAVEVTGYNPDNDFWYGDLYAVLHIDGTVVGGIGLEQAALFKRAEGDVFRSNWTTVFFEGCDGDVYAGHDATLEVLVRDPDGNWGRVVVPVHLKNDQIGPWLDANGTPC